MAEFPAIAHVAVAVTDVDASTEWYARLFDSKPVLHEMMTDTIRHVVFALGGTLLGLHGHQASDPMDSFAEESTNAANPKNATAGMARHRARRAGGSGPQ